MSTHQTTRQVLHRTRPCPEELRQLIALQNLFPPRIEPPDILGNFAASMGNNLSAQAAFDLAIKQLRQSIPRRKAPKLYKWLGPLRLDRQEEIFRRYVVLAGVRSLLGAVADRSGDTIQIPDLMAAEQLLAQEPLLSTTLQVTSKGNIQVKTGRFVDILEGVEAERIRRCSECTRIFWAGRVDKSACDDKCVNRRNVRLHRERYPEYKYQRYRKAEAASSMRPPLRERP
jgi:hypothetical protein